MLPVSEQKRFQNQFQKLNRFQTAFYDLYKNLFLRKKLDFV